MYTVSINNFYISRILHLRKCGCPVLYFSIIHLDYKKPEGPGLKPSFLQCLNHGALWLALAQCAYPSIYIHQSTPRWPHIISTKRYLHTVRNSFHGTHTGKYSLFWDPGRPRCVFLQNYSIKRNNSLQKKVSFASTHCMHKLHIKYMCCEKGKNI
jgi:hypothetical protein